MANQVVHFEIIGANPAALREFYAGMFGWDAPPGSPVAAAVSDTDSYAFIEPETEWTPAAGGIGGGAGFAPHVIVYVGVPNVAEALATAVLLGGTVELESTRNEAGGVTVGHFRDPAGNLMGVAGPA